MARPVREDKRDQAVRMILDAAMEEFAQAGYEGARVDEIARRAGMNKAMIYYRIGDKKTLYEAVIRDVHKDTARRLRKNLKSGLTPEEKLKAFIANIADTLSAHPHFARIMMQEVAAGWTNFGTAIVEDLSSTFTLLKRIIDQGVEKGVFAKKDPLVVHMMIIGTLLLYTLTLPIKSYFHAMVDQSGNTLDQLSFDTIVPQVQQMIIAALRPA